MIEVSLLAKDVFNEIENNGGKVYIVGGSVRDSLMDLPSTHDIDIEVYHLTYEQLNQILSKFGNVNTYGKVFAIQSLDTLPGYDFALPRKEKKNGNKHQDFDIIIDPELPLEQAIMRRDLTMNALMYDYSNDEIIDLCHGKEDIQNRIIRVVNPDRFIEDPLRVLRVAQFCARFNMKVDAQAIDLCTSMVKKGMLESLSVERVYHEYSKILLSPRPSIGFQFLRQINALPDYLYNLILTNQRADYHPEGNVFNHTMMVIDVGSKVKNQADDPLSFMWACLLHDVGKPATTDAALHSPNHAYVGAEMLKDIPLLRSKKQKRYIYELVLHHMQLIYIARKKNDKRYLMILKSLETTSMKDLYLISYCDKIGRGIVYWGDINILNVYYKYAQETYGKGVKEIVTGKDLKQFDLQPESYKVILTDAYSKQLDGLNKQQILEYIEKKYVRR